jgi:hypothetical protein
MEPHATAGSEKPIINLYGANGLGLIIQFPSGVLCSNQTGGTACLHPAIEGIFVPLHPSAPEHQDRLLAHFTSFKYGGWCSEGIDAEDADLIDAILAQYAGGGLILVDRSRLSDSHEAWVFVTISPHDRQGSPSDPFMTTFHGFGDAKAILTWENSD